MEAHAGPSEGAAVLDIGGRVGAALVRTPATLDGLEIEIAPEGRAWDGTHVAVRRRSEPRSGSEPSYCALFGHLEAGRYRIRVRGGHERSRSWAFNVEGAQVAEVHIDDME